MNEQRISPHHSWLLKGRDGGLTLSSCPTFNVISDSWFKLSDRLCSVHACAYVGTDIKCVCLPILQLSVVRRYGGLVEAVCWQVSRGKAGPSFLREVSLKTGAGEDRVGWIECVSGTSSWCRRLRFAFGSLTIESWFSRYHVGGFC